MHFSGNRKIRNWRYLQFEHVCRCRKLLNFCFENEAAHQIAKDFWGSDSKLIWRVVSFWRSQPAPGPGPGFTSPGQHPLWASCSLQSLAERGQFCPWCSEGWAWAETLVGDVCFHRSCLFSEAREAGPAVLPFLPAPGSRWRSPRPKVASHGLYIPDPKASRLSLRQALNWPLF